MFDISAYTAKELRDRASRMNILGRSAMNKEELYAEIKTRMGVCHALALEENSMREGEAARIANISKAAKHPTKRLPRKLKKSMRKGGLI